MKRNRRDARQYAFQFLYAHEFHTDYHDIVFPDGENNKAMDSEYAEQMIQGVIAHKEDIDGALAPFCKKRKFEHMDKVDRAILRLALWEITYNKENVSPAIAINEAIQLSKSFGSDSSYKLVNAILDAYVKSQQ